MARRHAIQHKTSKRFIALRPSDCVFAETSEQRYAFVTLDPREAERERKQIPHFRDAYGIVPIDTAAVAGRRLQ